MGNSSGKDDNNNNNNNGGGGNNNNNDNIDKDSILTFNVDSPNNTNVFVMYANTPIEHVVKVLKNLSKLPVTCAYTLFFPGYQIATTQNKTKYTSYTLPMSKNDTKKIAEDTTNTKNNDTAILAIDTTNTKNDTVKLAVDTINTGSLKATVTQSESKCSVFTTLPNFSFNTNIISCTRDVAELDLPSINISLTNTQTSNGDLIIDCYLENWTTFQMISRDLIGKIESKRLFKEDAEPLSMYSFVLEKHNINKNYKDSRDYFLLPPNDPTSPVSKMLTHLNTIVDSKNVCAIYRPDYFSGQLGNVITSFLKYYETHKQLKYNEFYVSNKKIIAVKSDSRKGNIITYKNCTLDLDAKKDNNKSMFYIEENEIIKGTYFIQPASFLYGLLLTERFAYKDPPTEIFLPKPELTTSSNISFIYYHLNCHDNDLYMVPQIIKNAETKIASNASYAGFDEKFTLLFKFANYKNDTIFQDVIKKIKFLDIVALNNNFYVLTNIVTDSNNKSILNDYYFTVAINDPSANKYTHSVVIKADSQIDTFYDNESTKTNFIKDNPNTTNQGNYYAKQIVRIPDNIKTDNQNIYLITTKKPHPQTFWNFLRQCEFKSMWQNYIMITDMEVTDDTILSTHSYIKFPDIGSCVYPKKGSLFKKINDNKIDKLIVSLNDYEFICNFETFNSKNTVKEEHFAISFQKTSTPWLTQKDIPIGYQMQENSYNVVIETPQIVGAPIGPLITSVKLDYFDKIAVNNRPALLKQTLYYIILPEIPTNLVKVFIEFAEDEFYKNYQTSKFNLLMRPSDKSMNVTDIIKLGKIHNNTKFILYLYKDTTLSSGNVLTLKTPGYSDFQYIPDLKDLKPIEDILSLNTEENSFVVNNIINQKCIFYSVLRKDWEVHDTKTLLTLQLQHQIQLQSLPFDKTKIVNPNSKTTTSTLPFYITKPSYRVLTCVKNSMFGIASFLELLISSKDLHQKNDEFIITLHFTETKMGKYEKIYDIIKNTVPCSVYSMDKIQVIVLTNTPLNFDDNKIFTQTEIFAFVNGEYIREDQYNYIVNESHIVPRSTSFSKLDSSFNTDQTQIYFEQLVYTSSIDDFKLIPNDFTTDYPIVNFLILDSVTQSELNYIRDTFKTTNVKENLVIVCHNSIDYSTTENISIRKHLAILAPFNFPSPSIAWVNDGYYYNVRIDDNKSNGKRFIEFAFVIPNTKLDNASIAKLINEKSFVIHFKVNEKMGEEYSKEMHVLVNDVTQITYNLYTFKHLSAASAPKLNQWITQTNKYITYIRPVDRQILDGGSYTSSTAIILFVRVKGDLHHFELINLIVHLYQCVNLCCAAIIFNNNKPINPLSKIDYTIKNYKLNSNHFSTFSYNYIYHPTKKFSKLAVDNTTIPIIGDYVYYDEQQTTTPNKTITPNTDYTISYGSNFVKVDRSVDNKYSKINYDIALLTTDVDISKL